MLEVTLVKTSLHVGRERAREVAPYIKGSDVCAPESAAFKEESAREYEAVWNKNLSMPRARFSRWLDQFVINKNQHFGMQEFCREIYETMHRAKVGSWHIERFSEEEAKRVHGLYADFLRFFREGAIQAISGQTELGIRYLENAYKNTLLGTEIRDKNIAKNIESAEDAIRKTYPHITRDPLRLCIVIGSAHRPERYTDFPMGFANLSDYNSMGEYSRRVEMALDSGDRRELDRALLAVAAKSLMDSGHIEANFPEPDSMSFENLKRELTGARLKRTF